MHRVLIGLFIVFFSLSVDAAAQEVLYGSYLRPTGLNWQQLKTEHFRIIFPKGEEPSAQKAAVILERQYPTAARLSGGSLKNFPVVLSNYNDWSNGAVYSLNFRSEFDLAPFKGKTMNPQSGNWLETVLPHELLHATHANVNTRFSLGGAIRLLSPDLARSINFSPPVGLHEGLAVYYESRYVREGSGRLNYPNFYNQLNSDISSKSPWSMSQIFQPSLNTLPYDRNYIAGAGFVQWLADTYGEESVKKSIKFHYNFFFLGYGTALRAATGKWPRKLRREFLQSAKTADEERLSSVRNSTDKLHNVLKTPFKGVRMQRPLWVSDNRIVYYASQYNGVKGFYSYNLKNGRTALIKEVSVSADYNFSYDGQSNELYFSKYTKRPLFPGSYLIGAYKLDLNTNKQRALSSVKRVFTPVKQGGRFLALQTNHDSAKLVSIQPDGSISDVFSFGDTVPVSMAVNPVNSGNVAFLINNDGIQGVWLAELSRLEQDLQKPPALAFKNAAVHDISWHPDGSKILFTADEPPAMNIYEHDFNTGITTRLTSSKYNAFEAAYSPNADAIVYSFLDEQQTKLAVLERKDFDNEQVPANRILNAADYFAYKAGKKSASVSESETADWKISKYGNDLSWLKPRAILPVIKEKTDTYQIGAGAYSTDVLGSQSYAVEISEIQNRLWYDVSYTNKTFLPGFKIRAYNDPSFFFFNTDKNGDGFNDISGSRIFEQQGMMSEERGFSLSVPVNVNFKDLSRSSLVYFEPHLSLEQIRYYDLKPAPVSGFANHYKTGYYAQFNWRILGLPRDVQASSGLVFFSSFERALNNPALQLKFPTGNTYTQPLNKRWGHYYGVFGYLSPLRRFNQSLKLELRFLQQSNSLLYSTDTIRPFGFKGPVFPSSNFIGRFSTRYVIPVFYPDNGIFTVPLHLNTVYLSIFTHSLSDMNAPAPVTNSRTIVGGGLHVLFRVANINFEFGVGVGYEPARHKTQFIMGAF